MPVNIMKRLIYRLEIKYKFSEYFQVNESQFRNLGIPFFLLKENKLEN